MNPFRDHPSLTYVEELVELLVLAAEGPSDLWVRRMKEAGALARMLMSAEAETEIGLPLRIRAEIAGMFEDSPLDFQVWILAREKEPKIPSTVLRDAYHIFLVVDRFRKREVVIPVEIELAKVLGATSGDASRIREAILAPLHPTESLPDFSPLEPLSRLFWILTLASSATNPATGKRNADEMVVAYDGLRKRTDKTSLVVHLLPEEAWHVRTALIKAGEHGHRLVNGIEIMFFERFVKGRAPVIGQIGAGVVVNTSPDQGKFVVEDERRKVWTVLSPYASLAKHGERFQPTNMFMVDAEARILFSP